MASTMTTSLLALPSPSYVAICVAAIVYLYTLYRRALPKPYHGIPHNQDSAKRLSGDGPYIMALAKEGKRPRDFWANLCAQQNSPITQFFPGPFFDPIVVISDFREAQDLLCRRSKEVDRGWLSKMMWSAVAPDHFVAMDSKDPRFAESKQLQKDLMSPIYIQTVATPAAYNNVLNLVEMWKFKAEKANGRPFKAIDDLNVLTADTIFESGMGITGKERGLERNMERLRSEDLTKASSRGSVDSVFPFPEYEPEGLLDTITVIADVTGKFTTSPIMQLHWPINNLRPIVRRAQQQKRDIIRTQIDKALQHSAKEGLPPRPRNALEYMISRERNSAKKTGRPPLFHTNIFHDALYGYCFGGQDTTHSALAFLIKHFGSYPDVQKKLRTHLREAHAIALAEGRNPTGEEMNKAQIPYLDAFLEEVVRLNTSASAVLKEALNDMQILGHHIPKGTQLLIPLWGPSINQPAIPVPEEIRSPTAQQHLDDMPSDWSYSKYPPPEFHPERWLRRSDDEQDSSDSGKLVFNNKAGPGMTFSLGPRECWGKKLAYLQLRLLTTLMVWNFEFLPLPQELENWDIEDILNAKPKVCLVRLRPLAY